MRRPLSWRNLPQAREFDIESAFILRLTSDTGAIPQLQALECSFLETPATFECTAPVCPKHGARVYSRMQDSSTKVMMSNEMVAMIAG